MGALLMDTVQASVYKVYIVKVVMKVMGPVLSAIHTFGGKSLLKCHQVTNQHCQRPALFNSIRATLLSITDAMSKQLNKKDCVGGFRESNSGPLAP